MPGYGKPPAIMVIEETMSSPDYSGPGYNEARRTMLHGDGGRQQRVDLLRELAGQLDEAVRKHSEQASRLRSLADEICREGRKKGYGGHGGGY